MEQERIIELYQKTFGKTPLGVERLPGAGSNRIYFRIKEEDETSKIGVYGTSKEENQAFCSLARLFAERHLPVPAVYAVSEDAMCYLQEDLGSTSLFDFIGRGRESGGNYDNMEQMMLRRVVSDLPRFQFEGASEDVYEHCYPLKYMDETSVMFDLNYFKYCYLKLTGVEFHEIHLENDFRRLCDDLLAVKEVGFMYRDFQARNVMLKDGTPFYIDFQGGRRGPIYYDVASFLWQASAKYSDALRKSLIEEYMTSAQRYMDIDRDDFMQKLQLFVFFRTLQVLGAYGFRGLWERKKHFIDSIPQALKNLSQCLENGSCDSYPYLKETALRLIQNGAMPSREKNAASALIAADSSYCKKSDKPLVVTVYSFSYKKGIPEDESGNGGGYVFDCRSTHNPGRYEQYKQLTGLDQPVIQFLEEDGEILNFLESVYKLVDFHVQRFIDRGFTHLMLSFGCTGGQHRSVYSAQHVAEHLNRKFGIEVQVHHREQHIDTILKQTYHS